ncbi:Ppx/GppA phosphatase family protein [Mesorhizobium sp.]|uniref:Ppx/GppA phosphatase family protein n=1 Tax=Mesorhizobium sp. TaxID=1871066 RepID=UPI0035629432
MEDRDTGADAPEVGASSASPGPAGPGAASWQQRRPTGPRFADGHAGDAAQNQKGKPKKRRKRRRGRKVFARDEARPATNRSPPPGDAPVPAAKTSAPPVAAAPPDAPARPEQGVRRPPAYELPVFAALDLGTNNCRLLVAVPTRHGQFRVIDAFSRIVRLGEGLTANGRLGQPAMDRAVEALKVCGDKLRNRKIRKARLIATEACRTADNGVEFLDRVEREAGLKLEIIDRQTEARLAVSGCGSLVERDTQGVVLFDIGGGSSEIALIDLSGRRSPRLANHIVSWTSLPVGVVSLAERFGGRTVTREIFAAMVDDVAARLATFDGRDRLSHLKASPNFHLLGTSGTVTTLAGVHLDLERYDRRRVDGLWMDRDSVDRMVEKLVGWDFQQRCANPCIGADRADLVLAGCAILEAIRAVWPSERLRVADRGLREGILSELMADDGVWRNDGRGRA